MGAGRLNLADALRHVMAAAEPLTDWIGDVAVKFSTT